MYVRKDYNYRCMVLVIMVDSKLHTLNNTAQVSNVCGVRVLRVATDEQYKVRIKSYQVADITVNPHTFFETIVTTTYTHCKNSPVSLCARIVHLPKQSGHIPSIICIQVTIESGNEQVFNTVNIEVQYQGREQNTFCC